jgi:hypothetical protein
MPQYEVVSSFRAKGIRNHGLLPRARSLPLEQEIMPLKAICLDLPLGTL